MTQPVGTPEAQANIEAEEAKVPEAPPAEVKTVPFEQYQSLQKTLSSREAALKRAEERLGDISKLHEEVKGLREQVALQQDIQAGIGPEGTEAPQSALEKLHAERKAQEQEMAASQEIIQELDEALEDVGIRREITYNPSGTPIARLAGSEEMVSRVEGVLKGTPGPKEGIKALRRLVGQIQKEQRSAQEKEIERLAEGRYQKMLKDKGLLENELGGPTAGGSDTLENLTAKERLQERDRRIMAGKK